MNTGENLETRTGLKEKKNKQGSPSLLSAKTVRIGETEN